MTKHEPIVYIVDDDPAFRESLSILILAIGYRSKTFSSADDFLQGFDETKPGCIFLDVRMPRISGLALQEKLVAFPQCPPIIILTGHGEVSRDPARDLVLTREYLVFLRQAMGKAVEDFVPFEEAYKRTDWSRFSKLPAFEAANRINAYGTYLLMEKESLAR